MSRRQEIEQRSLEDIPLEYELFERLNPEQNPLDSWGQANLGSITENIGRTARIYRRGRGGCWMLSAEWEVSTKQLGQRTRERLLEEEEAAEQILRETFIDYLMREVRVNVGTFEIFRGFLGYMKLTFPDGRVYIRDWSKVWNKVRSIYTRIGDNQLTNGSVESGAWASYNTPSTNEQSTDWFTLDLYSDHIVADSVNDGATIQTGIAIVANKGYQAHVSVNIVSGTWTFEIYRTDTDEALAARTEDGTGEYMLQCNINDDNTYAGNIGLRIYCEDASGEIYADAAVFQDAPYRADTTWYEAPLSQDVFGTRERVNLLAGASDDRANDVALTDLRHFAWAHTFPPEDYELRIPDDGITLEVEFYGYMVTANNTHTESTGTDTISNLMSTLAGETEYLEAGFIDADNSQDFQVDDRYPLRVWDVIEEATMAGDASGTRYECGVWQGRKFDYQPVTDTPLYRLTKGVFSEIDYSPIDPWMILPGYLLDEDMPLGPDQITGYETDNPRITYMFEVCFDAADYLAGRSGFSWRREPFRE